MREQAYFLFLYNSVGPHAVNKAVTFVPSVTTSLILAETAVTQEHWSLRRGECEAIGGHPWEVGACAGLSPAVLCPGSSPSA